MPELLKNPVERLIRLLDTESPRTLVGLAGYPGSGKSTIARTWAGELQKHCSPDSFCVLGMDGFHLTIKELSLLENPEAAFARRGAPWTFNPLSFRNKLQELREGAGSGSVGWPGFEHAVGDPVPDALQVPAECRLILVEGIYVLYRDGEWGALTGLLDESWFLDTPLEISMKRLYIRHQEAWGMTRAEALARADSNDRLNCEFIRPTREHADWIVLV